MGKLAIDNPILIRYTFHNLTILSGAGITLVPQDITEEIQPQIIDVPVRFGFTGGE